ncbi:MAG: hypothetical protein AB1571_02540 [Nanoarchaeota archaeon]
MEEIKDILKYLDSHKDLFIGVFTGVIVIIMLFFAVYKGKERD